MKNEPSLRDRRGRSRDSVTRRAARLCGRKVPSKLNQGAGERRSHRGAFRNMERGWSVSRTTPARCDGCKPDSVRPGCPGLDGHFSQESCDPSPSCDGCDVTRGSARPRSDCEAGGLFPCSVLHRIGFFVPPRLPSGRWALTPPFHPYPRSTLLSECRLQAVFSL